MLGEAETLRLHRRTEDTIVCGRIYLDVFRVQNAAGSEAGLEALEENQYANILNPQFAGCPCGEVKSKSEMYTYFETSSRFNLTARHC